ncbi:hypothetical protein Pmar_PMAR008748, partial [Perkinsus marinus ATCC 50983]
MGVVVFVNLTDLNSENDCERLRLGEGVFIVLECKHGKSSNMTTSSTITLPSQRERLLAHARSQHQPIP